MAIVILLVLVVNVCTVLCVGTISLGYKPSRPSYAGATGGTWGSYVGQLIPPGKPWPSKAEDYEGFSVTSSKTSIEDKITIPPITTTSKIIPVELETIPESEEDVTLNNTQVSLEDRIKDTTTTSSPLGLGSFKPEDEVITFPELPVPNRPPFIGATGGNFIPQSVPPGKPWPARPEDYEGFNKTSQKPNAEDSFKETTTIPSIYENTLRPEDEIITTTGLPEHHDNATLHIVSMKEIVNEATAVSAHGSEDNLNALSPKIPVSNIPHFIQDTSKYIIPVMASGGNFSAGLEGNESGKLNLGERVKEVAETSLMINETDVQTEDKLIPSKASNQTNFNQKMPMLSIYLTLEDIKYAIESTNNEMDGSSSTNKYVVNGLTIPQKSKPSHSTDGATTEPSLVVSLDLEALREALEKSSSETQKKRPVNIAEHYLAEEKMNNDGINKENNSTSIRFNISDNVSSKADENNPLVYIFLNIEDFKSAMADFSPENKAEASSKYFRVEPIKPLSDSTTSHPVFPYLGVSDTISRNVSTLMTPEAEKLLV